MIKPLKDFKDFLYTQYFSDGIKITIGVMLPSLIFFQFNLLEIGITISLGALCVSIADSPGPWIHRKNGMLFTILFISLTSFVTALVNTNVYLLSQEIFSFCFVFAMFNIYGERAAAVGTAALLVMVLNIIPGKSSLKLFEHAIYVILGGGWYFLLSIAFSKIRPYRYAQQTLGECISEIADYLKLRARFYTPEISVEDNFKDLVNQQIKVNNHLDNVREALFKTRKLLNDSTNAGRLMVKIFVDMVDLFEQTMATNNDYDTIRRKYEGKDVLIHFNELILKLSKEVNYIGFCLVHQEKPNNKTVTIKDLDHLKYKIDLLEKSGENVLILKKILINLRNIYKRTLAIQNYFGKETQELKSSSTPAELSRFVNHQSFDWKLFKNNLNLNSSVFRFSLRLAVVCLLGFMIGKLFSFGHHSYWIILTILVILKPGFSNTKQRNFERVIGTIIGGILGALILTFVVSQTLKFIILLVAMLITYSFIRVRYIVSVIAMTPFVLILFNFINTTNNTAILASERILDTLLGSLLAILFSYFFLPGWESLQFKSYLGNILKANLNYFEHIILRQSLMPVSETEYKLARKEVYVNTANLAAAFQRMIKEPKSRQNHVNEIHKFVVLNHILSSYLANLSAMFLDNKSAINSEQLKLIRKSRFYLEEAIEKVNDRMKGTTKNKLHIHLSENKADQEVTEQLQSINKLSADLNKISEKL
ncbi:FUSC family protein [Pedobacter sp. SD-b]|uniref:FUSC family protein n=1 Tax=Pedobacter segetis TaxID=2793069 RepID=A0ABS1BLA0_9SPHI|nr:FUSC family membrane protein [Pedobacter segetis]MBK0383674.1 FUSC family protein [Pedobacter segetis]